MNIYVFMGKKIKELRKEHQMTQAQLAHALHVNESTVARYEYGDRTPSYDVLVQLADLFHVSVDYLLGREAEPILMPDGLTEDDILAIRRLAAHLRSKNATTSVTP